MRRKGEDTFAMKRRRMPYVAKLKRDGPFRSVDRREMEAMVKRIAAAGEHFAVAGWREDAGFLLFHFPTWAKAGDAALDRPQRDRSAPDACALQRAAALRGRVITKRAAQFADALRGAELQLRELDRGACRSNVHARASLIFGRRRQSSAARRSASPSRRWRRAAFAFTRSTSSAGTWVALSMGTAQISPRAMASRTSSVVM